MFLKIFSYAKSSLINVIKLFQKFLFFCIALQGKKQRSLYFINFSFSIFDKTLPVC